MQSIINTIQRYKTLYSGRISALPIVILMPHSACNCKCVMCDIWKGNHNLNQLSEQDIGGLLNTLKRFKTQVVVMSGGEALMNKSFFTLCEILKSENINISLLSTGLLLKKNAATLVKWVDDIIGYLDGNEEIQEKVRNISGALNIMK